jgi:hypothetical protein
MNTLLHPEGYQPVELGLDKNAEIIIYGNSQRMSSCFSSYSNLAPPTFGRRFAHISPTFRPYFANILPTFCRHFADILPTFCRHFVDILLTFC